MVLAPPSQAEMIERLVDWGQQREDVRALILTSSRCNPGAAVDLLSDYDVIYYVRDIAPYLADETWLNNKVRILKSS